MENLLCEKINMIICARLYAHVEIRPRVRRIGARALPTH